MRKMLMLVGLLVFAVGLFVACAEDQVPAPEGASFARVSSGCEEGSDEWLQWQTILTHIEDVYEDRNAIRGAEKIVSNIARKVCTDPPSYDATPSMAEGFYQHVMNELEHLIVPLAEAIDLVELVFDFALPGDAPSFPDGAFDEETGTVAVILPGTDDVVQTPNLEAALVVDPASFEPGDPVTVVLTRISDGETPIPGFVNFAERYSVFVSRPPAGDGEGMLVAVCVPDDQDLPSELALGHTFDGQVEILVPVDPGEVLDCTQAQSGYPFVGAALGLAGVTSRWIQPVVDRILGVEPLHASYLAGTGLGGRTKSFSPFAPVDPTIEVGETVQLTIGTDATWTTSDAEVATVDNTGLVTGISEGSATITATVAGVPYTILITVQPAVGGALPLTCAAEPAGGDRYYRGFYVPSYPGSSLAEVELQFSADITGSYTMRLTAFADVYDGVELGTAVASQDLNGRSNYVATAFDFGDPIPISLGSTVAFRIEYVSGPGTVDPNNILLFYRVPSNGDPTCPIAETNGTSPPLDTWRRDGIWVTISG
jgi:hypothetical protein